MKNNEIETITGTRVIHCNHHLPTKGGLRFSETSQEDLESLAEIMSYKASLHNIPFGGAKGCININPDQYTFEEKVKITRRYTVEMWKRSMISASTDVMSPDIGTDEKIMNVIKETYKLISQNSSVDIDAVVTGKSANFGGLQFGSYAAGYGIARSIKFIDENLLTNNILKKSKLEHHSGNVKRSVIFHGFNFNHYVAARRLRFNDYKIVGITDDDHGAYSPMGFDPVEMWQYKKRNGNFKGISKSTNPPENIISQKCDIFVAGMKELSINKSIVEKLKCKVIVEAINNPLTKEAYELAIERGILVIPDLIAYSGGFIMSYLEWLKNLEHKNLTLLFKRFDANQKIHLMRLVSDTQLKSELEEISGPEESELVTSTLEEILDNSFLNALQTAEQHNIDLKTACIKIALERIFNRYYESSGNLI